MTKEALIAEVLAYVEELLAITGIEEHGIPLLGIHEPGGVIQYGPAEEQYEMIFIRLHELLQELYDLPTTHYAVEFELDDESEWGLSDIPEDEEED